MLANLLLPALPGLYLNEINADDSTITLLLTMTTTTAVCPLCHQTSHYIHSRYMRTLADLP